MAGKPNLGRRYRVDGCAEKPIEVNESTWIEQRPGDTVRNVAIVKRSTSGGKPGQLEDIRVVGRRRFR
jgi:hypothetical protein